ncbi:MAG: hypothetical protein IPF87_12135 [Gemmatimonadetes bacterium]|jgi:hypothetical protein|nr:hypothetical protein [Gemmatimonadota bacterium]HNV75421.1 hypothetical protein [Gemmatimonadaceae bacterium]MBK6456804.1 hypothetical protein [Gemmatimonadota bacterium]MBK6842327.1 hypothetical protein [Gemmatimonadota bacterium]MBK7836033.1 hypothetical protein [Gemmatimonadota bacterium]
MPKSSRTAAITGDHAAIETPRTQADRMFRAAQECIRQRHRYARLVERAAHEEEQQGALRIACICDDVLIASVKAYETTTATGSAHREEDWWHKANSLWHASREYSRRHEGCDKDSRKFTDHSPARLAELTMEYDLEASALLALQHAVQAYRKAAPDAELESNGAARVA